MEYNQLLKQLVQTHHEDLQVGNYEFFRIGQLIKLSVITQFFPPDYAATGQLIEELTRHLAQQGVDIEVFTGQPGYAFASSCAPAVEQSGGVRIK